MKENSESTSATLLRLRDPRMPKIHENISMEKRAEITTHVKFLDRGRTVDSTDTAKATLIR